MNFNQVSSDSESELENEESDYDSEGESSEEDQASQFRNELADLPLGELEKLKETVGLKKYSEALFGKYQPQKAVSSECYGLENEELSENKKIKKAAIKKEKSEPEERSSKSKPSKFRKVIDNASKRAARDPRFDSLSGHYNEDLFEKSYGFVDDMKKQELQSVRRQLKKVQNKERKGELQNLYKILDQQNKSKEATIKQRERNRQRKKDEMQSVKEGKKAFYVKNSDKKKLELANKYRELKSSGQLEKYMSKKRKKNASKEKKKLPYSRQEMA